MVFYKLYFSKVYIQINLILFMFKLIENIKILELIHELNKEAKHEKLAIPPINKILYWWSRKPLIVSRAMLLLSVLPYDYDINYLKHYLFNREKRSYKYNLNTELISLPSLKVLDPFAGAGNLIFEASRYTDCYTVDYNPVAYLIQKAVLEYPRKYKDLSKDVLRYGIKVIELSKQEVGDLYPDKKLVYFYARCITCPYCKHRAPLVAHAWLANTRRGKRIGVKFTADNNNDNFNVEIINNISKEEGEYYTVKKGKGICYNCKNTLENEILRKQIPSNDIELIAILNDKNYERPTIEDKQIIKEAENRLKNKLQELIDEDLLPIEDMNAELYRLTNYGITQWYQLFTPRQLLVLTTVLKNIRKVAKEIEYEKGKDYAKVITTYLAFMLCKHVDHNSTCTRWDVTTERIFHTLSLRSPTIIYNFIEINPFEQLSGSLYNMLNNIVEAIEFSSNVNNSNNIHINLGSALHLQYDNEFDLILTDPPYMDIVIYGDYSEFFYVWLYRALKDYYPELPARVPLDEDIVLSKRRFNNDKNMAIEYYRKTLTIAFKNMNKALKDDGLAVIFFVHSSLEAWLLLLNILINSGFKVTASYAIHTESTENILIRDKVAYLSTLVIVCRKVKGNMPLIYAEDLITMVESKIDELLTTIKDKLYTLTITDLLVLTYGKVLEVCTSYVINSYSKEQVDFKTIFIYAREYILRRIIQLLTLQNISTLSSELAFYLIGRIYFNGKIPLNHASYIAKAFKLNSKRLKQIATKNKSTFKLKTYKDYKMNIDYLTDNLYEQLMFMEYIADKEGIAKLSEYLNNYAHKFRIDNLKNIVALLLKFYENNSNNNNGGDNDNKNKAFNEYSILKAISKVLGNTASNTLDYYFS